MIESFIFQCALDTFYWTGFNHVVIWGSIIFYFCFIMAFYASVFNYVYQGVAFQVFSSAKFWLTLLLSCVILIIPVVAHRFYYTAIKPSLIDRIRLKQRLQKSKTKLGELRIRRSSTIRRSVRSMRSGYAFAHQEGFGELITSGTNMRERAESVMLPQPVKLTNVKRLDSSEGNGAVKVKSNTNNQTITHPNSPQTGSSTVLYSDKL